MVYCEIACDAKAKNLHNAQMLAFVELLKTISYLPT